MGKVHWYGSGNGLCYIVDLDTLHRVRETYVNGQRRWDEAWGSSGCLPGYMKGWLWLMGNNEVLDYPLFSIKVMGTYMVIVLKEYKRCIVFGVEGRSLTLCGVRLFSDWFLRPMRGSVEYLYKGSKYRMQLNYSVDVSTFIIVQVIVDKQGQAEYRFKLGRERFTEWVGLKLFTAKQLLLGGIFRGV